MKVDLDELKKGVEQELQGLEKRRTVLVQSLDQIKAVEALVKGDPSPKAEPTKGRQPAAEDEEEESAGFQLSRLAQFRDVLGNKKGEEPAEEGKDDKDVNIEFIETGS